jgi:hypothetical protein
LSLSSAIPIQSTPTHPIFLRSILILSTNPYLGLQCGFFPSGYHTNNLYTLLFSSVHATYPAHLTSLHLQLARSNLYMANSQITKLPIMQFLSPSHHFILPQSKYSPQHPFSNTFSLCRIEDDVFMAVSIKDVPFTNLFNRCAKSFVHILSLRSLIQRIHTKSLV